MSKMSKTAQLLISIRTKMEQEGGHPILGKQEMMKILWNCAVMLIEGSMPECLM